MTRLRQVCLGALGLGLAWLAAVVITWAALPPVDLQRFESRSPTVLARDGTLMHVALSRDHAYRLLTRPQDVDPKYLDALVALEDQWFWSHPGVDPLALLRAAWQWGSSGHVVSGGSTITMQVARLLEPKPRTVWNKWLEMMRAFQLEWRYSKPEILTMYMTMLPMGGNVESVRAASLRYWGVEPKYLSLSEVALLLAVPQSPEVRRPDLQPEFSLRAVQSVARKLVQAGLYPADDLDETTRLPFERLHAMPRALWHLAQPWAKAAHGAVGAALTTEMQSTIDPRMQVAAERLAQRFAQGLNPEQNVAVLIANASNGDVLAHIGSLGLGSKAGYMDLTRATRSPGSTLKPFIYGMGFDDGLLNDQTVLEDRPKSFNGYAPSNFDHGFSGLVRAGEALQQSLNVPAVEVMQQLGPATFEQAWQRAGLGMKLPKGADANLGITLGAVGVDLWTLVEAYTSLANGGRVQKLKLLLDQTPEPSRLLMTAHSAEMITDILASAPSIDGRMARSAVKGGAVAFKTGTSYGYRDSWALGTKGSFVIGVWVGRPSATPEVGQTGRRAALRLAYDLADALPAQDNRTQASWQALPIASQEHQALDFELISPRAGQQLVLSERASAARSIELKFSGSMDGTRFKLNGQDFLPVQRSRLPVPDDGFYELEVIPARGAVQRVRFAVLGRT